jgi:hypothetical protein
MPSLFMSKACLPDPGFERVATVVIVEIIFYEVVVSLRTSPSAPQEFSVL